MQKVAPLKSSGKNKTHFIALSINDIKEEKDSD